MDENQRKQQSRFEDDVRRIARQLWPSAEFGGAAMVEGLERDGVFKTDDCIHLIEATVSRAMDKAAEDVGKLVKLGMHYRKAAGTRAVRGWFITLNEPTGDQRAIVEKYRDQVNALSFSQFQAKLVDTRGYLDSRENLRFGSVRDPVTGAVDPKVDYIEVQLAEASTGSLRSPRELAGVLREAGRVVVLGD